MDDRTAEILRRFDASWDKAKTLFDELIRLHKGYQRLKSIREFIDNLELAGGREQFRLGTSVDRLIISRSVEYGLRPDQKYILIEALLEGDFEVILGDGEKVYRAYRVNDLMDIRVTKLLQTLKGTLID